MDKKKKSDSVSTGLCKSKMQDYRESHWTVVPRNTHKLWKLDANLRNEQMVRVRIIVWRPDGAN